MSRNISDLLDEQKKTPVTQKEKAERFKKKNPAFKKLIEIFDLVVKY